jgi:alkylhydroperoxidase/carboxymuconolactone decarboxylase family protein YurZ
MGQMVRFQETLRRLAIIDECFATGEAGLDLGLAGISALDPKTAALLQLAATVASGSPAVCLEWSTGLALAAGASEDEIADVLLAIAQSPGSAWSSPPFPKWRPRLTMTSRLTWRS